MSGSLLLLCLAVLLGIASASYTRRCVVTNLFASVDCIDAETTALVRVAAGVGSVVCTFAAVWGLL
jgi:uncharacterized membrane protein YcjF (UPF0283 family)